MDMMTRIYNAMIDDDYIEEKAYGRIKYYEYPPTDNLAEPHIIIDPLDTPTAADFADDTWLTNDYLYQIEVWSNNRLVTKGLADRVRMIMWDLGFRQSGGIDRSEERRVGKECRLGGMRCHGERLNELRGRP